MATPNRKYTEVPGSITPDVPYRLNQALREIDADVAGAVAKLGEVDAGHAARLAVVEAAAGFGSGLKLQDDVVNGLLLNAASKTSVTLGKQIDTKAVAAALVALDTPGTALRQALDALTLEHLAESFHGPMSKWGAALRNPAVPAIWVNLGSSTANGGNTANFGLSWVGRIATYLTGRSHNNGGIGELSASPARPAKGTFVYNGAVGGTTSSNYMDATRLANIKKLQPTLITHMIGANDLGGSVAPATYKANLRNWMDQLQAASPDTVHLYIHQQGRQLATPKYAWAEYGRAMREVAGLYPNVAFLDASERFTFRDGLEPYLVSDGYHMNQTGHRIMADLVAEAMGNPIPYGPQEVARIAIPGSTTTTVDTVWKSFEIPPAPYPRHLNVDVAIFGYGTGTAGTQGPEMAVNAFYTDDETKPGDAQQIRILNGAVGYAQVYTASPYYLIDANRTVRIDINSGPKVYISGSGAYSKVLTKLTPA